MATLTASKESVVMIIVTLLLVIIILVVGVLTEVRGLREDYNKVFHGKYVDK